MSATLRRSASPRDRIDCHAVATKAKLRTASTSSALHAHLRRLDSPKPRRRGGARLARRCSEDSRARASHAGGLGGERWEGTAVHVDDIRQLQASAALIRAGVGAVRARWERLRTTRVDTAVGRVRIDSCYRHFRQRH